MTSISRTDPVGDRGDTASEEASLSAALERLLSAGIGITARAISDSEHAAALTLAQWRLLVIATHRRGPRVGELAAHLGVSVPSASRLVRRLEMRGLVETARAEDDRRATTVSATRRGRDLVDDVIAQRRGLIEQALRDQPRDRGAIAVTVIEELAARMAEFA